jgi:pimeloyl-ACP methyl ester carboxylesterase
MATFVLVHGAYQGGWIWQPVAKRLRAAGHTVHAPTLDGCAERQQQVRAGITVATHAQEIAQLLFYEDLRAVVLVGTSAGGMVILKAAEQARDRIARLVFVDALALVPGERVDAIVKRPAPNRVGDLTTGPTKEDAANRMFKDLEPGLRAWALERITPHPIAALEAPMVATTFWDQKWTAGVIRCTQAANPPETHQRRTAEKLGAPYAEMETGHYPMLSAPDALTTLLLGDKP